MVQITPTANNQIMLYSEYSTWHTALMCGDIVTLHKYLDRSSDSEKLCLVKGRFDYQDHTLDGPHASGALTAITRCTYPFTIAVFYGSWNVVAVLLDEGADPSVQEEHKENILHLLVVLAADNLIHENDVVEIYDTLMGMLSVELKQTLLHAENGIHQRPLEYAANRGTIQLLRAMFDTYGVYRVAEIDIGMIKYIQYDITEYETNEVRRKKSPLYFLAMSSNHTLSKQQFGEFLEWKPIKQWCKAKQMLNIPPLCVWLVARIIMISFFHVIALDQISSSEAHLDSTAKANTSNTTALYSCVEKPMTLSDTNRYIVIWVAIAHCSVVILLDWSEIIVAITQQQIHRIILIGNFQDRVLNLINISYRVMQHATFWNSIVLYALILAGYEFRGNIFIGIILSSAFMEIYYSSLVYLFIFPSLGFHVIIIYRVSLQLGYFCVLLLIMILPFSYFFLIYVRINSNQGCIEDFQDIWYSIYTTIRIMLNMIDITGYDVMNNGFLLAIHTFCVFVIAIMMINFLIAIMTNTTGYFTEHRHVIQILITIWICLQAEVRRTFLFGYYYKKQRHKYMKCHKGRVYVFDTKYIVYHAANM